MALRSGEQLGPYEVVSPLGAGGMGEVYRARDPRLGREVALKVLPEDASSPQRLRRFEEEARAVAALNHPHILAVFDIGHDGDTPYVVFELLEGQTLHERLERGALPPRKVVEYAEQLCQGLAAAHARGIIHRDLKPANIFLTKDGTLKILDFGLARLTRGRDPGEATGTTQTSPGTVLGTLGYLSPEQAQSRTADARSDVFAAGAVLYEMLSGKRAFGGATTADALAAVLKEDPPELASTAGTISPALDRIVRRCLEKEPDDRFQSAKDVAFALEALSGATTGTIAQAEQRQGRARQRVVAAALVLAGAAVALAAGVFLGRHTATPTLPTFTQITFGRGCVWDGRFTPDGHTVVYGASRGTAPPELFSTRVDSPEFRPLGLPAGGLQSISTSGELALLLSLPGSRGKTGLGTLARVPLAGGTLRELLEDVLAADWAPDGSLAVMRRVGPELRIEWPIGEILARLNQASTSQFVRVSPRGDLVAFEDWNGTGWDLQVMNRSGERKTLVSTSTVAGDLYGFAWAPGGNELWCGWIEPQNQNHVLKAVDMAGRVRSIHNFQSLWLLDISAEGRVLIAASGGGGLNARARGPGEATERDISVFRSTVATALSRNGLWLLTREDVLAPRIAGIYFHSTLGGEPVRIRGGQPSDGFPVDLSNDGQWALFREPGPPPRLVLVPTGAGEVRAISLGRVEPDWGRWSDDGEHLLIGGRLPGQERRLFMKGPGDGPPKPVTPEGVAHRLALLSPRVRWVALSDGHAITLYPVSGGDPLEIPGGEAHLWPVAWSSDERSLFVRKDWRGLAVPAQIWRLDVLTGQTEPWRDLGPTEVAGLGTVSVPHMTTDGRAYAYTFLAERANLYIVDGLK